MENKLKCECGSKRMEMEVGTLKSTLQLDKEGNLLTLEPYPRNAVRLERTRNTRTGYFCSHCRLGTVEPYLNKIVVEVSR